MYYFDVPDLLKNEILTVRVQTTSGATNLFARFGDKPGFFNQDATGKETGPGMYLTLYIIITHSLTN